MPNATPSAIPAEWVVVANEACAIVYARQAHRDPLVEIERLANEQARLRNGDINADRGGRAFDRRGFGRHGLEKERHGPKQQAAEAFARRVVARIEAARQASECRDYALVAAPRFLGSLRSALSTTRCPTPYATVDKDVTGKPPAFIAELLKRA